MGNKIFDGFFNWIYRVTYANIVWFGLTLLGGIFFGLFPASVALTELVNQWKQGNTAVPIASTMWSSYKKVFKKANGAATCFYLLITVCMGNLMISLNQQTLIFLMIDFFLIFVVMLSINSSLWAIAIMANYEIPFKEMIKLGFGLNYFDVKNTLLKGMACLAVVIITSQYPALLLFGFAVGISFLNLFFSEKAINHLDQMTDEEAELSSVVEATV